MSIGGCSSCGSDQAETIKAINAHKAQSEANAKAITVTPLQVATDFIASGSAASRSSPGVQDSLSRL